MNEAFKGFWGFWRGVFSESDGTPSSSRVFTGMLVSFACGWVTNLVCHNHLLPDFAGLSLFVGSLYGVNRLGNYLQGKNPPSS